MHNYFDLKTPKLIKIVCLQSDLTFVLIEQKLLIFDSQMLRLLSRVLTRSRRVCYRSQPSPQRNTLPRPIGSHYAFLLVIIMCKDISIILMYTFMAYYWFIKFVIFTLYRDTAHNVPNKYSKVSCFT